MIGSSFLQEGPALPSEILGLERGAVVKTSFTLEVTPRKSGVEGGWDLASPYVVCLVCMLSGPIFWGWSEVEIKTCHEV